MTLRRLRGQLSNRSLAKGLGARIYGRLRGPLYLDRGPSDATFFLAGSPRSGTTWVAEQVASRLGLRLVFEPFHPEEVPLSHGFGQRPYLRPSNMDPTYLGPAERIVFGRLRSSWTDRYNRSVFPRARLVKEVRANLMLSWLHERFPGMPIALVLRHPGAVAASQLSVDWGFHAKAEALLAQPELVEDHLRPFISTLEHAGTPLEESIAVWCVEQFVPLHQFRRGEIHLVCYEHLLVRPEVEFERLLSFYGLPMLPDLQEGIARPSGVTTRDSAVVRGGDILRSWQTKVPEVDRSRIGRILETFGLNRLYGDDPMPQLDDPNELLPAP